MNKIAKYFLAGYLAFLIVGLSFTFMISPALADEPAIPWEVESTLNWNAVYGRVSGLDLKDGDVVGVFDVEGNCYGAGSYKGGQYFLSAFSQEEADSEIPNDFVIEGFKDGDEVIFKVYKADLGKSYVLEPVSGEPFIYQYEGRYPPMNIDLLYSPVIPPDAPDSPFAEKEKPEKSPQESSSIALSQPIWDKKGPITAGKNIIIKKTLKSKDDFEILRQREGGLKKKEAEGQESDFSVFRYLKRIVLRKDDEGRVETEPLTAKKDSSQAKPRTFEQKKLPPAFKILILLAIIILLTAVAKKLKII